ncbi:hypothetical protein QU926_27565 [Pseudomonas asiatica]|uniref:hypothetical protein n=1 Tax=Pseudomonas asiatica TaxID=2219225 RepID=UPI0025AA71B1|nr:hypothetical protein [Pseudomonas asiatica]MDM9557378.1 hypothetical protein [Pseudomonas asiatica]
MQKFNLSVDMGGGIVLQGYLYEELPLAAAVKAAALQIDQSADQARTSIIGGSLRVVEYEMAEQQAAAFKAADFQGDVPVMVQAVVDAEGVEAQEAAEAMLAEAAAWRGALCEIRAIRLKGKAQVLKANSHAEAEGLADAAIAAIRDSIAGITTA